MPTPNYNLPLITPASPISIVDDMNGLATAVDSALAQKPDSGDVTQIRTLATQANETANTANSTASSAISAANSANTTAQNAVSLASQANTLSNEVTSYLSLTNTGHITTDTVTPQLRIWNQSVTNPVFTADSGTFTFDLYYAINAAGTYGKIYGRVTMFNLSTSGSIVPMLIFPSGTFPIQIPSANYAINYAGLTVMANADYASAPGDMLIMSDGRVGLNSTYLSNYKTTVRTYYWPCAYVFANFGDSPIIS